MRFSVLAYITLAAAATPPPVTSSNYIEDGRSSNKSISIEEGWEAVKSLFDKPSKITDAIHEGLHSLSDSVHTWYDGLHVSDTGESFWHKITELGPNIKEYADEQFHHAVELYPSEQMTQFRVSVDSVTTTATALHKVCSGAVEDSGVSIDSIAEELADAFSFLFEELKEMFPPPEEAPGHENRTIMINTVLDRIEEGFLPFAIKLGVSEELLKSHSTSLKFDVQHLAVTIGDLVEQHPDIANALVFVATAEIFVPLIGMLLEGWFLRLVLRFVGFGPQGPIKGGIAAWVQRWLFGSAIPQGSWFGVLQRLAMIGAKI